MHVIFLDFDNVLNGLETREPRSPVHAGIFLNPECVARLDALCARTRAVVVLSTSWRHRLHDDGRPIELNDLRRALVLAGFRGQVRDATPDRRPFGSPPKSVYTPRSDEIRAWLDCENVSRYVILDDEPHAGIAGHFVHVTGKRGLTDEHVERAVAILGGSCGKEHAAAECPERRCFACEASKSERRIIGSGETRVEWYCRDCENADLWRLARSVGK